MEFQFLIGKLGTKVQGKIKKKMEMFQFLIGKLGTKK